MAVNSLFRYIKQCVFSPFIQLCDISLQRYKPSIGHKNGALLGNCSIADILYLLPGLVAWMLCKHNQLVWGLVLILPFVFLFLLARLPLKSNSSSELSSLITAWTDGLPGGLALLLSFVLLSLVVFPLHVSFIRMDLCRKEAKSFIVFFQKKKANRIRF